MGIMLVFLLLNNVKKEKVPRKNYSDYLLSPMASVFSGDCTSFSASCVMLLLLSSQYMLLCSSYIHPFMNQLSG